MPLRGTLDLVTHDVVAGWAWDTDAPDQPVSVILSCDGAVVARVLADHYRRDLEQAGIGGGRHAFHVRLPVPLSRLGSHSVAVRREDDGQHLNRSPRLLEPGSVFDRTMQDEIAAALAAYVDADDLARRLAFLAAQTDRLRQLHADAQSGANRRRVGRRHSGDGHEAASVRPRALVVDGRMPAADNDAGSNAVLSHMRALRRLGYDVVFAPADLRGDGAALEAEGIVCCLQPAFASIEEVLRRQRNAFQLVYLHRVTTAARYVLLVRDHQPRARIVYSVADLHHLRLERQAQVEQRPELTRLSEHVRLTELTAAWLSDAVITHSSAEAALLRRHMPAGKVHVVPWSLSPRPTAVPFCERQGFAFVGAYRHRPNVDAALWLVEAVLPEIEAGAAGPCVLVGSDMPDSLSSLRRPGVDSVGHVPALATVFDRVRLTVAPLAFGAGVKGKVLDSLAAGIPCVCTPAAAEGLDLPELLLGQVGTTPAELARLIQALHANEALNRACSEAGLAYIATIASEQRVDRLMRDATGLSDLITDAG